MQFGRFHGIVLLALAALLLAVQSALILNGIKETASTAKSPSPSSSNSLAKEKGVSFLPAGIAIVLAFVGTGLVIMNRPANHGKTTSATQTRSPAPH
jgi:hypothetical protein